MSNIEKLGSEHEKDIDRPKSAAFGIGGAGRNIISSFDRDKFFNIDIYEVGDENRLDKFPSIKVYRDDVKKILTTKVSEKYRGKSPSEKVLEDKINNYDVLYLLCGLGGEMGSCISTVCSELSNKDSVFSVALYATPFKTESPSRIKFSQKTKTKLEKLTDISVAFSNHKLLNMNPQLSLKKAFEVMNNIISIPMEDLNSVITKEDLSKLKVFCDGLDGFSIGSGYGKGREKGKRALNEALRSPWLKSDKIDKIIALITRGENSTKYDVEDVLESLETRFTDSKIIYGVKEDKSIKKRMRVTILTGKYM